MNVRSANGHKRREVRTRVLREENDCYLCHEPVDKTIKTPDDRSPEVHELIPVSLGGSPTDRTNCRLTHRGCNRRQGNRLDPITHQTPLPADRRTERTWWT
ncbi:HNH endonuclease [Gordonia alkaliphila]|uniref:HNH domain-containing protein n=1 Tax=Gordonia alkaliphila TaxID=1053547 RepID=A0ABP8ZGL4_9ACTN